MYMYICASVSKYISKTEVCFPWSANDKLEDQNVYSILYIEKSVKTIFV